MIVIKTCECVMTAVLLKQYVIIQPVIYKMNWAIWLVVVVYVR